MAEFLFIQPTEITSTTIMGGNVDIDKYLFCIADTQISVIEPLLGTELYDKILADAEADIEVEILARISENDSAGGVHVDVRYLPADGVTSAGAEVVYGFNSC